MPEKTQTYEIVPVDPFSKLEKKSESLEHDIREIKSALRGTVGLSKIESNADAFISKMLDMLSSSQKMVEQVANSNQKVATQIEAALEKMNKANEDLSNKLTKILNFFAQATDAMGGEEPDLTPALQQMTASITGAVGGLKKSMDMMIQQNMAIHKSMESMEKHLKKAAVKSPPPTMPPPPKMPPPPPMMPPPGPPAGGPARPPPPAAGPALPPPSPGGPMPPSPAQGLPPLPPVGKIPEPELPPPPLPP